MRHRQMTLCIKLLVELFEAVFFFRRKWLSCASATLKRTTKHWMDVIDDVWMRSLELCHGESRHPQCYWSSRVFFFGDSGHDRWDRGPGQTQKS